MNFTNEQADQLQQNVLRHSKRLPVDTIFPEINEENAKIKNPDAFNDVCNILRMRYKNNQAIFLSGNAPSSKNSKNIVQMYTGKSDCCKAPYIKLAIRMYKCTSCGNNCQLGTRPILHNSKTVQDYIDNHSNQYILKRPLFLELIKGQPLPLYVGFYLIRQSAHRYDYINSMQIILDLFVKHCWIVDDSTDYIIPIFLGTHKDQKSCGVIIKVINSKEYKDLLFTLI